MLARQNMMSLQIPSPNSLHVWLGGINDDNDADLERWHVINWAQDPLILVPIFMGTTMFGHFSGLIQGNRQDSQKVWTPSIFQYYPIIGRRNINRSERSS
jgi:hypothetical protein